MLIGSAASILLTDLLGLTRFLANTQDALTNPADATIVALLNHEYTELQTFLAKELLYDWRENTLEGTGDGSIALVDGTNSYAFPTGMLTIERMEITYTGDTNSLVEVKILKQQAVRGGLQNTSDDASIMGSKTNPISWIKDGYFKIDPIPDESVSGGLKIYCTLSVTALAIGGAGDALTPVFASAFHKILSIGAAAEWLKSKDKHTKAGILEAEKNELKKLLVDFYANREKASRRRITSKSRNLT